MGSEHECKKKDVKKKIVIFSLFTVCSMPWLQIQVEGFSIVRFSQSLKK